MPKKVSAKLQKNKQSIIGTGFSQFGTFCMTQQFRTFSMTQQLGSFLHDTVIWHFFA